LLTIDFASIQNWGISLFFVTLFLVIGTRVWSVSAAAFVVGVILYFLDAIFLVFMKGYLRAVSHLVVLFLLYPGLEAAKESLMVVGHRLRWRWPVGITLFYAVIISFLVVEARPLLIPAGKPGWLDNEKTQWPQLVFANEVKFRDGRSFRGGSSSLLRLPGGDVVVSTSIGFLNPETTSSNSIITVRELSDLLESWKVILPAGGRKLEVAGLYGNPVEYPLAAEWIFLSLNEPLTNSTAVLSLSLASLQTGDRVFILGHPPKTGKKVAQVVEGSIGKNSFDFFTCFLDERLDMTNFRGGPILDSDGHQIGISEPDSVEATLGFRETFVYARSVDNIKRLVWKRPFSQKIAEQKSGPKSPN